MSAIAPPISFLFRVNARGGGHTHVSIFAGTTPGSRGRCGGLVMRDEEWTALHLALSGHPVLVQIEDK